MTGRTNVAVRHLAIIGLLVTVLTWLWRLDVGGPVFPAMSLEAPRSWINGDDATRCAVAIVRVAALGLAAYLLALTIVGAAVRWIGAPCVVRAVDRLTLPFLRVLLGGVASLGVVTSPPAAPSAMPMTSGPAAAPGVATPPQGDDAQATLHLLPADEPTPDVADTTAPVAVESTWTVAPGESFWAIAASHLRESHGSAMDERAIVAYWQRLIDVNRDRLAAPDDPDLLFVDQVLMLPPVDTG